MTVSSSEVKFETETEEISLPIEFSPKEYSCTQIENFLILEIKDLSKAKLFIFNPKTLYFKMLDEKNLAFEKSSISFDHVLKDFASTSLTKTLTFDKNTVTEKIISPKFADFRINENTVCYAFLESIINENYPLAKKLLAGKYSSIEDDQFREYFGKCIKFFHIKQNKFLLIYNDSNKIISFTTFQDQIEDFAIEEI